MEAATLEWLAYADHQERVDRGEVIAPMSHVELPEALRLKIQCENRGLPWSAGGLADQPHILMLEWNVIDNAKLKADKSRQKTEELLNKIKERSKATLE